jgi:adenylyltransferase/sulfurtransferase
MPLTNKYQKYQRQIQLNGLGVAGQDKLFEAKVLVIGAGGLGCPALQYLAAAGVGYVGIVDFDLVEITNLQRQILFEIEDVGKPKAAAAALKIKALNPDINVSVFNTKLDISNALDIISGYDVIIDGTDNFASRYLINDACVLLDKPFIYGSVLRFEGQVGVFNIADPTTNIKTHYRDLFPKPPDPINALSCRDVGVLGVIPGIIGVMQATEAIKIITGVGEPLCNTVLSYNVLNNRFYEFHIFPSEQGHLEIPKSQEAFLRIDYEWFCGNSMELEMTIAEFDSLRHKGDITIFDVRESGELPLVNTFEYTQIPLSRFEKVLSEISKDKPIVIFCKSGKRSLKAVTLLKKEYPYIEAHSLKDGIEGWMKEHINTKLKDSETGSV